MNEGGVDAGVPWHYGDPLREQRAMAQAAAVVDRTNRGVLTVPGADRLSWLHTISTQHLSKLGDGETTEALVLSPHGHVEQHWQLAELGGQVWLDVEPGASADVLAYLDKMRFFSRVEPADVSADFSVVSLVGPASAAVLAACDLPVPEPTHAIALAGAGLIRRAALAELDGFDLIVPRSGSREMFDRLVASGAAPAGTWAYDAIRVEQRRPRLGFETDHRTIPHEVGWIGSAVHLNKGCYRGQETVARVQNLGQPPRRLVLLHLGGEALPERGTPVESGGRAVGFIGTAVHHHELGPVALGVIKRTIRGEAELTVAGSPVALDPADR
ncbi:MAG: folate-binding protein YgfZ [Actinobacteria bacterium]|nr:folate-binding protein YgfZ [Actinomycetota bacterium]